MIVHDKIRTFRQARNWTQEEMANKLKMSPNGYGCLERGETDVNLSRLQQIAEILEVSLSELFETEEKNIFNIISSYNHENYGVINESLVEHQKLKSECEKLELMLAMKDKELTLQQREIEQLNKIISLMEHGKKHKNKFLRS